MARKNDTILESIILLVAKLPWQLALFTLFLVWVGWFMEVYVPTNPASPLKAVAKMFYILLFLAVGIGTLVSLFSRIKRGQLLARFASGEISNRRDIGWREFELLCQAYLEKQGYHTEGNFSEGADGGIDLKAYSKGKTFVVQAKHWNRPVGVKPIRELYGVQQAVFATGSIFMAWSGYTREAELFAKSVDMILIDEPQMRGLREEISFQTAKPAISKLAVNNTCPICSAAMVRRVAKKGANIGNNFWGCSRFPQCRGVRNS